MKSTPGGSDGAMKPLNAPMPEEIERVEAFLRKHMYPETLEAFLQEKTRAFRRTSPPTGAATGAAATAAAAAAYVPVAVTSPMYSSSSSEVHDPNHANCCWTCIVCEKVFTKKGSAKRHCDTAHLEETAAERVECPQCSQKFNRRDDLYAHIRRIHHTTGGEQLVQELIHTSSLHRRQPKRTKKASLLAPQQLQLQLQPSASPFSVSLVTHQEHVDCVLPSGGVICPPSANHGLSCSQHAHPLAHAENNTCENASAASAAVLEETHFRVLHDGHEDVIVNGTLQHYNDQAGVWENHGELSGFEYDLDFLAGRYEDQDLWDEEVRQVRQDAGVLTLPQGSTLTKAKPQDCCARHHVCEAAPSEQLLANHDSVAISSMLEAMRNTAPAPVI